MKVLPLFAAITLLSTTSTVFAAGFALNEQSIKGMGTALAGRASAAADATTVYTNPAGMAFLEGNNFSTNGTYIYVPSTIDNVSAYPATGSNNGDMVPAQPVGATFFSTEINTLFNAGIGIYAPFGLATNYEDSFAGRYFGDKSKVKVITLQPTISYQASPLLSFGAGLTINRMEGLLSAAVSPNAPNSMLEVKGNDTAMGYNLGVLWQAMPSTRVGLTYHSAVDYTLTGTTEVRNLPSVTKSSFATYDASLAIGTPASFDFSVSHQLQPSLTVHMDATQTQWSKIKQLNIQNSQAPSQLSTVNEVLDWHNSWMYSVGADWQWQKGITLRAGLGHDQSPISDEHRSVRVPSADRDFVTLGASYAINEKWSVDWAYMFIREATATVNQTKGQLSYQADYHGTAHLMGAQLNWQF